MAEKLPEANIPGPESPPAEKEKSGVSHTTDEKAEESGKTVNISAQHGSELSGTKTTPDSAAGTSENPTPEPVKSEKSVQDTGKHQKPESSKEEIAKGDSNLKNISKSPVKASRTKSRKKSTPEEETDVSKGSEQKTVLQGSPSKPLSSSKGAVTPKKTEEVTPPKTKSPSILMRLRSHSKLRSGRSSSVPPNDGSNKTDDPKGKAKGEKSSEIYSPAKRRGLFRKAKSVGRERSNSTSQSESMDISEIDPNLKELDEKGSKTKSKASVKPKLRSSKREEAGEKTPTVEDPEQPNILSPGTACEQVSTGIESIQLSKEKDAVSLLCHEESIDSSSSGASGKEEIGTTEATKVEEMGAVGGAVPWRPQHSHQEGGFQKDVIWAQFSSSAEDTGTEESVVSASSALKGSEMKKVTSTDTLAEIPGLKEEEASGGQELAEKSVPQGQKRVKGKDSSDSDEDSKALGAVSGSPVKKMAPEKKSADDGSEE